MKSKKKIIISIVIVVISIVVVFMLAWRGSPLFKFISSVVASNDDEMTDIERIVKVITETKPTDIIIFGEDIEFPAEISYRTVSYIDETTIESNDAYMYTILIVNDSNNTVLLSDKEQLCIEEAVSKEGFCLIYLGQKYSTRWDNEETPIVTIDGNMQFTYYTLDGTLCRRIGMWLVQDQAELDTYPQMLGDTLMHCFDLYLKEVN